MLSERSQHKERAVGCVIVTKDVPRLEQLETVTRADQSDAHHPPPRPRLPHTTSQAGAIDPAFGGGVA